MGADCGGPAILLRRRSTRSIDDLGRCIKFCMTQAVWTEFRTCDFMEMFLSVRPRPGDKGRDERRFLTTRHDYTQP